MQTVHTAAATLNANFDKLAQGDKLFAASLCQQFAKGKKPLSEKQTHWLFKLAERAAAPAPAAPATVQVAASFAGVIALFAKTEAKLKRPKVVLALADGREVRLSLAAPHSKNPGHVYVRLAGEYAGKVSPGGGFTPFKLAPADEAALADLLCALAADPAGVAAAYGKLHGACCFCSIKLTDPKSTSVGYGKICADNYGLPWGDA